MLILFAEFKKVTIISDSIAKIIFVVIFGATLQAFPGQSVAKVANQIQSGNATLDQFDYLILHVGTNDLGSKSPFECIISDFWNIIGI